MGMFDIFRKKDASEQKCSNNSARSNKRSKVIDAKSEKKRDNLNYRDAFNKDTKTILNLLKVRGFDIKYDIQYYSEYGVACGDFPEWALTDGIYILSEMMMGNYHPSKVLNCSNINVSILLLCRFILNDEGQHLITKSMPDYWRIIRIIWKNRSLIESVLESENDDLANNDEYKNFYIDLGIESKVKCIDKKYAFNNGYADVACKICKDDDIRCFYFAETSNNKGHTMGRKVYCITQDEFEQFNNGTFNRIFSSESIVELPEGDNDWTEFNPLVQYLYQVAFFRSLREARPKGSSLV